MEHTLLHRYDDEFMAFIARRELPVAVNRRTGAALGFHQRAWCAAGDPDVAWQVASGRGVLLSFTVTRRQYAPDFPVPLVHGLVELEEGPRLICRLAGLAPEDARTGLPVRADYDSQGLLFRPAPAPPSTRT